MDTSIHCNWHIACSFEPALNLVCRLQCNTNFLQQLYCTLHYATTTSFEVLITTGINAISKGSIIAIIMKVRHPKEGHSIPHSADPHLPPSAPLGRPTLYHANGFNTALEGEYKRLV